MTELYLLGAAGHNGLTGSLVGKPFTYFAAYGNSNFSTAEMTDMALSCTGLCLYEISAGYTLTQTQVDTILESFWSNNDSPKIRVERKIRIDQASHAAPSAVGLTAKTNLQNAGWTVLTN